ncbi:hypothetical protein N656DRAFT_779449 [Canariomyces notabilis]|uniref:Uncharacterized protein n=1 Tax=Canariomyces notabilis TaxID=2074819 RepID=A0AAN6TDS4_9PEZI|nr:hypothetical protein N656DRAFT_779449 [Canariomyces arenarius]
MTREPGSSGRSQLKTEDLIRIQTLSRDAKMGPNEIERITGYSSYQIKYAIRKKTPTVGKRTGRPRKHPKPEDNTPKGKTAKKPKETATEQHLQSQQPEQPQQPQQPQQLHQPQQLQQLQQPQHMPVWGEDGASMTAAAALSYVAAENRLGRGVRA